MCLQVGMLCIAVSFHCHFERVEWPFCFYFFVPNRVCYQIAPRKSYLLLSLLLFFISLPTFCGETLSTWLGGGWKTGKIGNKLLAFICGYALCRLFGKNCSSSYQFYGKILTPKTERGNPQKNFRSSVFNMCTVEHEIRVDFLKCVWEEEVELSN